jgi:hypothetical protein
MQLPTFVAAAAEFLAVQVQAAIVRWRLQAAQ